MSASAIYELIKVSKIKSAQFPMDCLPLGSSVTLASGIQGVVVVPLVAAKDKGQMQVTQPGGVKAPETRRTFSREEVSQVSFNFLQSANVISTRTAVLSLTAATKAFGWLGGIVGAGIASTTVTVQNFIIGGHVPWGTTQTTLASKLGMSVGSLAVVSSWIGFGIGVVATPLVYMVLRNRVKDNSVNLITVFNETGAICEVSIIEITNVTIAYSCIPSKPEIRTIFSFILEPGGVVIDAPIPNEQTSVFKLACGVSDRVVDRFAVYAVTADSIHKLSVQ